MISYIKGKIKAKDKDFLTLENQGIGFKVFISQKSLEKIKEGEEKEFFTYFVLRNEKPEIYGFLTQEELKLFEAIEKTSGIGPKGALLISSLGTIDELKQAVKNQDFRYFSKIKGIGKKKVQKIILELGGSLNEFNQTSIEKDDEALRGLLALGFSSKEANEALERVAEDIKEPGKRIQAALQLVGKR